MASSRQKPKKLASGLSERSKWTLLAVASVVLVGVGGWWAYFRFTTVPPPPLETAEVQDVVAFLGHSRGFARMPLDQREQYLLHAYQQNAEGYARTRFIEEINRMSHTERQVLLNASFEVFHKHVMHHARAYNSLPAGQRGGYLDRAVREIEQMRTHLGGHSPADSVGEPLRGDLPTSSDEWMKILVTKTTGQERAEAKPFVDAMADRYKAMQNPRGGIGG